MRVIPFKFLFENGNITPQQKMLPVHLGHLQVVQTEADV